MKFARRAKFSGNKWIPTAVSRCFALSRAKTPVDTPARPIGNEGGLGTFREGVPGLPATLILTGVLAAGITDRRNPVG